jgi:biotin transport system substrate-specific component
MIVSRLKGLPLRQALNVTLAVGALAIASQCAIPLYYVPLSLQPLAVMVIAFSLPPGQATLSTLAWITSGAMGAPVFSCFSGGAGVLCGPRGGYIWGMLMTSFVISWCRFKVWPMIARSTKKGSPVPLWFFCATALLGESIVLTLGWAQLQFLLGDGYKAWAVGVAPFIVGDILKLSIVSLVCYYSQKPVDPYASSSH